MIPDRDAALAADFTERCTLARAHLRRQMEALGLRQQDGWRIAEVVRQNAQGGYELHMCPIHMRLKAPSDVECVVSIDLVHETVESECAPAPLAISAGR
jgi:hypothetical protein